MKLSLIVLEPQQECCEKREPMVGVSNFSLLLGPIFSSFVLFLITILLLQPGRCCFFSKPFRHKNIAVK